MLSIHRSFRASGVSPKFVCLFTLLATCLCSLPVLAQAPGAPPPAPPATQPSVPSAGGSTPSPQLMSLNTLNTFNTFDVGEPSAPSPMLTDPSHVFSQPMQVSYQAAVSGQPAQTGGQIRIPHDASISSACTPGIFLVPRKHPSQTPPCGGSANQPAERGAAQGPSGGPAQDFVRSMGGTNYKTRVQVSSSIAETHAPGHHRQKEQATRRAQAEELMKSFSTTSSVPPAPAAALAGASQASLQTQDGSGAKTPPKNFPFDLFSGLTFETSYGARAAVYEDTTRMASTPSGGFLPSAIPVENQPFFGGPARTNVSGSSSSIGICQRQRYPRSGFQHYRLYQPCRHDRSGLVDHRFAGSQPSAGLLSKWPTVWYVGIGGDVVCRQRRFTANLRHRSARTPGSPSWTRWRPRRDKGGLVTSCTNCRRIRRATAIPSTPASNNRFPRSLPRRLLSRSRHSLVSQILSAP